MKYPIQCNVKMAAKKLARVIAGTNTGMGEVAVEVRKILSISLIMNEFTDY